MAKVMYVSGVPVRAFVVGERYVAVVGEGYRQKVRSADTLEELLEKVGAVLRLRDVNHAPQSAAC